MRVIAAIARLGLIAACTAGWSVGAGEKVQLSGSRPTVGTGESGQYIREKLKSRSVSALSEMRRRPSLQGVTTSPFQAPRRSISRRLTKEDLRRLDAKESWIFQGSEEAGMSEENLYRAVGVRNFEERSSTPETVLGERRTSAMERYLKRRQGQRQTLSENQNDVSARDPKLLPTESDATSLVFGADLVSRPNRGLLETGRERLMPDGLDAGPGGIFRMSGSSLQPFGLERTGLGGLARRPGLSGAAGSEPSGIAGLLGASPIESVISPRSGGVTDPINAFPDLTRQEINPVTSPSRPRTRPLFPDPRAARGREVAQSRRSSAIRSLGLEAPSRSFLPAASKMGSSLSPSFSPSRSVSTHLDLPRRTF